MGERGREVAPYYNELRGGIGALLINSERVADPIAIHYSQPSMRIEWMLAQRPKGESWVTRNSSTEYRDSEFLRLRESWCRLIEDQGLQYNFVSYGQVEQGELLRRGYKVLVLPRSTALSATEAQEIRDFVAQGGTVDRGRRARRVRRALPPPSESRSLPDLFDARAFGRGKAIRLDADILNYHQDRLTGKEGRGSSHDRRTPQDRRQSSRSSPSPIASGRPVVGVETHTFRNGGVWIVALMTNPQLRVDELGPPEFKSNDRFAKPIAVQLDPPGRPVRLRRASGEGAGQTSARYPVTLDPYEPAIFAIAPRRCPRWNCPLRPV